MKATKRDSLRTGTAMAYMVILVASTVVFAAAYPLELKAAQAQVNDNCGTLPIERVAASGEEDGEEDGGAIGNVASDAIDRNPNTRWSNFGIGSIIQVDLGHSASLCSVDISWLYGDSRTYNFVISVSNDGTHFSNILSAKSTGETNSAERYKVPTVTAKFVRIIVNGNNENDWTNITEMSINGGVAMDDCENSVCVEPAVNDASLMVEAVQKGLEHPTSMAFLGPHDILVLEKDKGTVRRIIDGQLLDKPILDVNVATEQERGMLGIAIAKTNDDLDRPSYVFLYYTEAKGEDGGDPLGNRLYRYQLENNRLVNPKLLLDLSVTPGPYHNGGKIIIGPDNLVYLVIGDLHDVDSDHVVDIQRSQDQKGSEGELDGRGGILRVDQDGKSANPVIGDDYPLNLYYAYGIRNSFGIDFDPVAGNLWNTENGEAIGDEINLVEPGFNSGWSKVQGTWLMDRVDPDLPSSESIKANIQDSEDLIDFDGRGKYSEPEFTWWQTLGPTALKFLSSAKLGTGYKNDMFVGDVQFGNVYHFELSKDRTELALPDGPLADKIADTDEELLTGNGAASLVFAQGFGVITDIQVGYDGYIYILSFDKGSLFRIMPKSIDFQYFAALE